jgi:4-hydroxy-3-methylbut-2-enyl diphosphate reductase IspH
MSLNSYSTEELINELNKRGRQVTDTTCPRCQKYSSTYKHYAGPGNHLHCDGCNEWVENCRC